jgi:hypothetical protein
MAIEQDSHSAWQRFEDLQQALERGDAPPTPTGFAATQPMGALPAGSQPAPMPAPARAITLDEVMLLARRKNRACPVPAKWAEFHKLLPARGADKARPLPAPAPVDGGAWNVTSDMQKRLRLRDQIEWAEREGALGPVGEFLAGLTDEDWHHFGD